LPKRPSASRCRDQRIIVGAGNVGRALGGGWLKTGHKVTMAVREPAIGLTISEAFLLQADELIE
jgi:predicted dinucleotide-binding enzyme